MWQWLCKLNVWKKSIRNSNRRSRLNSSEVLERRTLLATLVSPTKLSYQDIDGDNVTVTFSKSILTAGNVNSIFTFDAGTVSGSNATKQQLRSINLTGVVGAALTSITTAAIRSATTGGDGFAALGQINATGLDLGNVTIDGDLGRIVAGDATTTTAGVGALKVHSMGRFGLLTGAANLNSVIQGKLTSLTAKTDLKEVSIDVQGGVNGTVGTLTIGGNLIGGVVSGTGRIQSSGDMGAVVIKGDVVGGLGFESGRVATTGKLTSITISGSLIGGDGTTAGSVFSNLDMGALIVTGNLSGAVRSNGKLASATIGGSIIGGLNIDNGQITSNLDMGAVKVSGNIRGGANNRSGSVISSGKLASLTVGGSIFGGDAFNTGWVHSAFDMGPVIVAGSVVGGDGDLSGRISTGGKLASASIGGSLIGGNGGTGGFGNESSDSGVIFALLNSGSIKITGDLLGGRGLRSGGLDIGGNLSSLTIGGSIVGGAGYRRSGAVVVGGDVGTVAITGNIVGGSSSTSTELVDSGVVKARRIGTMTLGSLIAGTNRSIPLSPFTNNGAIVVQNDIASLTLKGSVVGNTTNKALIRARGLLAPGSTDLAIGKLTIGGRVEYGQILAGFDLLGVAKNADAQIGPVAVGGDWIASDLAAGTATGAGGRYGDAGDAKISGSGVSDVATVFSKITSISIGGQVIGTATTGDHFGFVAENIVSFKVKGGSTTYPLVTGNRNDSILLTILMNDVRLDEI